MFTVNFEELSLNYKWYFINVEHILVYFVTDADLLQIWYC